MYPHPIRLRGPWQCELLAGTPEPPRQVTMPCRWDAPALAVLSTREGLAPVRFMRRFGYPGQIDADERVWLTLAGLSASCAVSLNGSLLTTTPAGSPWLEMDVTGVLRPRNELRLEMTGPVQGEQPWTEAALEVRCLAFLRGVSVALLPVEGRVELEVRGEVVGVADRPLELYVIVNRSPAGYDRVQPRPEGQPFVLRCPELPADRPLGVQIDLVNGATVWYTLTRQPA